MSAGLTFNIFGHDVSASSTLHHVEGEAGSSSSKIAGHFSSMGHAIGGALAAAGVGEFVKSAVEGADQLEGANIQVEHSFGNSAQGVQDWAKSLASSFGLSQQEGESLASTFSRVLSPMHLGSDQAAKMSEHFVELAQNIAAANHADPGAVDKALVSGLRGRATALRQYGIDLNTTTLAQYAANKGIVKAQVDQVKVKVATDALRAAQVKYRATLKDSHATELQRTAALDGVKKAQQSLSAATAGTIPPLTDAQKTQAAYGMILQQTRSQSDAYAEHSGTLAEQQKTVTAEFTNAKDELGMALMPVLAKLAGYLVRDVVPALQAAGRWISQNKSWLEPLAGAVAAIVIAWKAWTMAEAALNVVMDANPVLLIVAAIAALVVGLVEAYKHVGWFRDFVRAAFAVVKSIVLGMWHAIVAVWDNVGKPMFTVIATVVRTFIAIWRAEFKIVAAVFRAVWDAARAVFNDVIKPIFSGIVMVVRLWWAVQVRIFEAFKAAFRVVWGVVRQIAAWIGAAFAAVGTALRTVWSHTLGPVFNWIKSGWHAVFSVVRTVAGAIRGAFSALGGALMAVWNNTIGKVIGWIHSGLSSITGVVQSVTGAINSLLGSTGELNSSVKSVGGGVFQVGGGAHAQGIGFVPRPELARVNELGAEQIFLPTGSRVLPASQTRGVAAAGGDGFHLHVHVDGALATKDDVQRAVVGALENWPGLIHAAGKLA